MPQTADPLLYTLQIAGGLTLVLLGLVYAWKFLQALVAGKVKYWAGLEHFGWFFIPITMLTPFITFGPSQQDKTLVKTGQGPWFTLFYSPIFFALSLLLMTTGLDQIGLPGTSTLNKLVTFGHPKAPAAIIYTPPFGYKFPFLNKIHERVFSEIHESEPQTSTQSSENTQPKPALEPKEQNK